MHKFKRYVIQSRFSDYLPLNEQQHSDIFSSCQNIYQMYFLPIFLIAVLILILPSFLSTNYKLKEFLRNLSIWAIITLVIIVIIYFISL